MAAKHVQISAIVSEETRALLDHATEARGLKKGHVIEEALLHYLHALRELPSDVIIPSRLVLNKASGREVVDLVLHPREPTDAMKALMSVEDGDDVPT
ncbi:MAG: hypothetical protein EA397_02640 [Deltaproteobacteria bacterium]|nr:MAG: hypothetical protein EA397_02640 [Deltaproteobacteria bacterium]